MSPVLGVPERAIHLPHAPMVVLEDRHHPSNISPTQLPPSPRATGTTLTSTDTTPSSPKAATTVSNDSEDSEEHHDYGWIGLLGLLGLAGLLRKRPTVHTHYTVVTRPADRL